MTDKDIIIITNKLHSIATSLYNTIYEIDEYLDIQPKYPINKINNFLVCDSNSLKNIIDTNIDFLKDTCLSLWKNSEIYSKLYQVCKHGDRLESSIIWGWFENSSKTFQSFIKENYPNLIYNEKSYEVNCIKCGNTYQSSSSKYKNGICPNCSKIM